MCVPYQSSSEMYAFILKFQKNWKLTSVIKPLIFYLFLEENARKCQLRVEIFKISCRCYRNVWQKFLIWNIFLMNRKNCNLSFVDLYFVRNCPILILIFSTLYDICKGCWWILILFCNVIKCFSRAPNTL